MKRPTWATIIGILAIVFGVFGIFGGAKEMAMPTMIKMQKEMIQSFAGGEGMHGESAPHLRLEVDTEEGSQKLEITHLFELFEQNFYFPDWYQQWAVVIGLVSMLVAAAYILAGIFLLMLKPFAVPFFYGAMGASILWAVIQSVMYTQSSSALFLSQIPGALAGVAIDLILIIVVVVGSKEAFTQTTE